MNKLVALLAVLSLGAMVLAIAKGGLKSPRETPIEMPVAEE
jgi:hypothetical protein